jgi:hypothetical protein
MSLSWRDHASWPTENQAGPSRLTSNRVDHFTNSDQPEAFAFDMIVSFINMFIAEVNQMSRIKSFKVLRSPQNAATQWVELLRSGRREEAATQVAREGSRKLRAMEEAIDEQLQELARTRG